MLTEEQIKNLKPGDIVDVRGFVNLPLCNGNILVELRYEFDNRILPAYKQISTEFISMPAEPEEKPKYDPCRLFRKGDIVKCRTVFGRTCNVLESLGVYTVIEDEKEISGNVSIVDGTNITYDVKAVFLELITPVEELGPYYIEETEYEYCVTIMIGERKDSPAVYHKRMHPYAKKAAEAECERLNAEWRK